VTEVIRKPGCWALWVVIFAACVTWGTDAEGAAAEEPRPAENLFLRLGSVGLDPSRVYHLRDAHLDRPGFYVTLEDGTIGFTEDVLGHVTGAFFEGDGEVLVVPPDRAERSSLALFTGAAVLEEKFTSGYFRFNDETYEQLQPNLRPPEQASSFISKWGAEAPKLAAGDALRLLTTYARLLPTADLSGEPALTTGPDQFLHALLQGVKLGPFDLIYDSLADERVQVLQLAQSRGTNYYDIWMSFNPRSQSGPDSVVKDPSARWYEIPRYKIRARVTPPRRLEAETTLDLRVLGEGQRAVLFELSRYLQITSVAMDGKPLEFIHNPAISGSQLERKGNDLVAIVFPRMLRVGEQFTLRFVYGGDVLSEEASGLLSVGARGTWYPNRGLSMANFDLDFSYPAGWTLLATGTRTGTVAAAASQDAEGAEEVHSHWTSTRPIPVAGFNLGRYTKATARAGNSQVEAYATGEMESAVQVSALNSGPSKDPNSPQHLSNNKAKTDPSRNVQAVADRAAEAVVYFSSRFGEYPYGTLALTQSPGPASQGWPGLVFLSSYAFLSQEELAALNLRPSDEVLARQTAVHETAHQWWGDQVLWKSYRDQWISEGLASYCALLQLETKDPAGFRLVMDSYRDDLVQMKDSRRMLEAGSVTLGPRLNSSHFPAGYEVIAYGRGAWLFHMLRKMLHDAPELTQGHSKTADQDELFTQTLRQVQEKYAGKGISTREFLQEFAKQWPRSLWFEGKPSLNWFWDGWIQGISVPLLELKNVKLSRQSEGIWATGTIEQRDAPEDLVTPVPLYAQVEGKNPVLLQRIFADGRTTKFHLRVPPGTRSVLLDPQHAILRQH
jgi:Peptidase family M1 domain